MESFISKQPLDKKYPVNQGLKWTDEEERILLEELSKNIDIELIADSHRRTTGGINARRKVIAYNLYNNNISMEDIIAKTKLDEIEILATIKRKQRSNSKTLVPTEPIETGEIMKTKKTYSVENEIYEMRCEIRELKIAMKELTKMMKAIYYLKDV
jgi:hypothetical protein